MHSIAIRRTVIFFIILVLLLNVLSYIFHVYDPPAMGGYDDYKKLPEGSVDAVYVGNSGISRYWIASEAYDKYGMVVYPLSTDDMPSWLVQSMLHEAYRYQSPELAIIDVRVFAQRISEYDFEAANHYLLDQLPWFSANRFRSIIRTIKSQLECKSKELPKFGLAYFLPVLSYHDLWRDNEFLLQEKENKGDCFMGFCTLKGYSVRTITAGQANAIHESAKNVRTDDRVPIDGVAEESLRVLLQYIEKRNIKAMFIASPAYADEEMSGKYNYISDILAEYGKELKVFNALQMDGCKFDFQNDFLDIKHTNYFGAIKYTKFFADYLKSNYDFPDHRNDSDTSMFDGVSQKIADFLLDNSKNGN